MEILGKSGAVRVSNCSKIPQIRTCTAVAVYRFLTIRRNCRVGYCAAAQPDGRYDEVNEIANVAIKNWLMFVERVEK